MSPLYAFENKSNTGSALAVTTIWINIQETKLTGVLAGQGAAGVTLVLGAMC